MTTDRESARELWRSLVKAAFDNGAPCPHERCKIHVDEHGWYARIIHQDGDTTAERVISADTLIGTKRYELVQRLARWLAQQHLAEPAAVSSIVSRPDADLVGHIDGSMAIAILSDRGASGGTAGEVTAA